MRLNLISQDLESFFDCVSIKILASQKLLSFGGMAKTFLDATEAKTGPFLDFEAFLLRANI